MSGIKFLSSGGGAILNLNEEYERFGQDSLAVGGGTVITGGTPAATKGAWVQLLAGGAAGVTVNSLAGFDLFWQAASGSTSRGRLDLSWGAVGGDNTLFSNFYIGPNTSAVRARVWDLNIPAGTKIWARVATQGALATFQVHGQGNIRTAASRPLWTTAEEVRGVSADTNVVSNTVDTTSVTAINTGWTEFVASTPREYGALMTNLGPRASAAAPTPAQYTAFRVALGAAASEVWFHTTPNYIIASVIMSADSGGGRMIRKTIPSGSRISTELVAVSAGMVLAPQIWGLF